MESGHRRHDSGFDDTFISNLIALKRADAKEEKKKPSLPWYKQKKRACLCGASVVLLIIIVSVVSAVMSSKSASDGQKNNSTDANVSTIQWPILPSAQTFKLFALTKSNEIKIYDSSTPTPSSLSFTYEIARIIADFNSPNPYIIDANEYLYQNQAQLLKLTASSALTVQSTPIGLLYQSNMSTISLYDSPVPFYQSPATFSFFFFNSTSQLLYIITQSTITELEQSNPLRTYRFAQTDIQIVSLLVCANRLYLQDSAQTLLEIDLPTLNLTRIVTASANINSLACNQDLGILYLYSADKVLRDYDLSDSTKEADVIFANASSKLAGSGLAYSSKAKVLFFARDGFINVWDQRSRRTVFFFPVGKQAAVYQLAAL